MNRQWLILSTLLTLFTLVGCGQSTTQKAEPTMRNSADSMSYVLGLNIGRNLMGIDSLLNIDMVCQGVRDAYNETPKFNDEEARLAYMKYMNYDSYERVKRFESQFLADLRKNDRKFVATTSGLTYKVTELGDLKKTIRNNRDTILLRYRMLNMAGEIIDTTYYRNDTLRIAANKVPKGVLEATKLIGKGGHIEAWVPSTLGYGAEGCDSLGVEPNTILFYELWLMDVIRR